MMQQIAMEAVQQGAMLAYASFSKVKDVSDHEKQEWKQAATSHSNKKAG